MFWDKTYFWSLYLSILINIWKTQQLIGLKNIYEFTKRKNNTPISVLTQVYLTMNNVYRSKSWTIRDVRIVWEIVTMLLTTVVLKVIVIYCQQVQGKWKIKKVFSFFFCNCNAASRVCFFFESRNYSDRPLRTQIDYVRSCPTTVQTR